MATESPVFGAVDLRDGASGADVKGMGAESSSEQGGEETEERAFALL